MSKVDERGGRVGLTTALSSLGRRAYLSFWSARIARFILSCPSRKPVTIKSISEGTFILPDDVIVALKEMEILKLKTRLNGVMTIDKSKVREWAKLNKVDTTAIAAGEGFVDRWKLEVRNGEHTGG